MIDIPERDWKYLRSIFPELLEELSRRINDEVRTALSASETTENEKRHLVYQIVRDRDKIIARCFDDWRRSRAIERCVALRCEHLLKDEHVERLSEDTRRRLLFLVGDAAF